LLKLEFNKKQILWNTTTGINLWTNNKSECELGLSISEIDVML